MNERPNTLNYDNDLLLKSAGLVAATANGSTIIDLGPGLFEGELVIDVSAVEVANGDEIYDISLEGGNAAALDSGSVQLVTKSLGNAKAPRDAATSTGRFVVPFRNEENGTTYRYARIQTTVAGTVATGINFSAWIAKH